MSTFVKKSDNKEEIKDEKVSKTSNKNGTTNITTKKKEQEKQAPLD